MKNVVGLSDNEYLQPVVINRVAKDGNGKQTLLVSASVFHQRDYMLNVVFPAEYYITVI